MPATQWPMLPKIKDFSSLLMTNDLAGSVGSSGLRKASSGVAAGLNIAAMAKQRWPIGVDRRTPRPTVARDRRRGVTPFNALARICARRSFRLFAAPKVALKEPAVA
jgi:hypothetical protein